MSINQPRPLSDTMDFLDLIGFVVGLDEFGDVSITGPGVSDADVIRVLMNRVAELKTIIESRARSARSQFIGGPFNGKPTGGILGDSCIIVNGRCCRKFVASVGRAKWAVYTNDDYRDTRMFFRGFATSKQKARAKAFESLAKTAKPAEE